MSSLTCMVAAALCLAAAAEPTPEAPGAAPAAPAVEAPQGDRITLKSGRELRGVKVLHSTSFKLVLEVIPTVEPLEIPLRQVVRIDYGLHPEPAKVDSAQDAAPSVGPGPEVQEAVMMSPELARKLHAPVVNTAMRFQDQDIVNILRSTAILSEIELTFGVGLDDPEGAPGPRLTVSLLAGQSFDAFLREAILPEVPGLKVEYRFQSIHFELERPRS